jgi:hypothetical protein
MYIYSLAISEISYAFNFHRINVHFFCTYLLGKLKIFNFASGFNLILCKLCILATFSWMGIWSAAKCLEHSVTTNLYLRRLMTQVFQRLGSFGKMMHWYTFLTSNIAVKCCTQRDVDREDWVLFAVIYYDTCMFGVTVTS